MPGLSWGAGTRSLLPSRTRGPTFWGREPVIQRGRAVVRLPRSGSGTRSCIFSPQPRALPVGSKDQPEQMALGSPRAALGRPVHLQVESPRCRPPVPPSLLAASTRLRGLLAHPPAALCPPTPFPRAPLPPPWVTPAFPVVLPAGALPRQAFSAFAGFPSAFRVEAYFTEIGVHGPLGWMGCSREQALGHSPSFTTTARVLGPTWALL